MLKRINLVIVHIWNLGKLRHLFFNHANRKARTINWHQWTKIWQKMPTGSNMIQVRVREENRLNIFAIIFKPFRIWHHVIDARVILTREERAHINQDNLTLIFDSSHILTDTKFAKTANRNNAHRIAMLTGSLNLRHRDLLAIVAVITGFIYWNTNNMLSSLGVNVLAEHTLMVYHFPLARAN